MSVRRRAPGRSRRGRTRGAPPGPWAGRRIEVDVGPVAHGGHCVARHEGRVIFVRHALPGERVVALVTEDTGGAYCRADAVEVLRAAPDRVDPPCPHAGPGRCGGCDWQHAHPRAQRALKAAVVRDALARIGGLADVPVTVEELAGGPLGWRTRMQYAVTPDGRVGLRRHRSRSVEPVRRCLLATPEVDAVGATRRRWPGASVVEVAAGSGGGRCVLVTPRDRAHLPALIGWGSLRETAAGLQWQASAGVFWQVHPAAAEVLAGCVTDLLRPMPGETVLDLYCGAGLFAGVLARAVGSAGQVLGVEADPAAVADAEVNLGRYPWAAVRRAVVTADLVARLEHRPDVVVLDPPRSGAGRDVVAAVCARRPRAVAYVACDPAALARDVRAAVEHGYCLGRLRAFDLFPMTHHVECVALLIPRPVPDPA